MASEIISAILSRFQGVRRSVLWFRGEDRAQAVLAVRVMTRYGKCDVLIISHVRNHRT